MKTEAEALRLVETDPACGYRVLVQVIAERLDARIRWHVCWGGGRSWANWQTREVCVPAWHSTSRREQVEPLAGVAFHELGHLASGRCPEREPHRRDPRARDAWYCLQCEIEATTRAFQFAPMTRGIHAHLSRCLQSYIRTTPAAPHVVRAARELAGNLTWFVYDRQQRQRHSLARYEAQLTAARRA